MLFVIVGFLVGGVVGMTGIGGALLMTPILILVFGIQPLIAVATDLLFAAITKIFGVVNYLRKRIVSWRLIFNMMIGGIPGSLIMSYLVRHNLFVEQLEELVKQILSIVLVLTALLFFQRTIFRQWVVRSLPRKFRGARWWRRIIVAVMSFGIGMIVTLSSVGGGAITLAMLAFLYPSRRLVTLVGTDMAYTLSLAIVASSSYVWLGIINYKLLFLLLLGSIPGVLLGSWYAPYLQDRKMHVLMGGLFIVLGVWMMGYNIKS